MSLSSDERALLAILRCLLSDRGEALPGQTGSAGLAQLLRRHHLRPLADELGVAGLSRARQECAVIASLHRQTLEETGRALGERHIAWTAIKGAAYAWSLYEDPALRPMSDLDILVQADDFERALQCLDDLGYRQRPVSVRTRHAQTFTRAPHEIIDLHRSILQPLRSNDAMSEVWLRAEPSGLFPGYSTLTPTDLCCVHIAHIARHEFVVPLVSYVDLQRLLGLLSPQQTDALHRELERWRLTYALSACRALIAELGGNRERADQSARMRLVLPTRRELLSGSHRNRATQIRKKLMLFPRDAVALGLGWALRTVEDRWMPGSPRP